MVDDVSSDRMIAMLDETIAKGRWAIFCFHGIGGDHLTVETTEFEGLLRFLNERQDEIWTDTVHTIGSYVARARPTTGGTPEGANSGQSDALSS